MDIKVPPLPRRVSPLPWEDSASFISRVSHVMRYERPEFLLSPECLPYKFSLRGLPLLHQKQEYRILQRLFRMNEEMLYQLTLHRFATSWPQFSLDAPSSGSIERPLLDQQVLPRHFLSLTTISVCPRCLEEVTAYNRLFWRLRSPYLCPTHITLLIDKCPACKKRIPALRPIITHCPFCSQGDYREISTYTPGEGSPLHIGQLFWFYHHGLKHLLPCSCFPLLSTSLLATLSAVQYEHLSATFQLVVLKAYQQQERLAISLALQALPRDIAPFLQHFSHELVWTALFHFCFLSWPSNLFAFLDLLYQTLMLKNDERYVQMLCNELFSHPNLVDPAFHFLHQAYAMYSNTCDQPRSRERTTNTGSTPLDTFPINNKDMSWIQDLHAKYGYFHHRKDGFRGWIVHS